MTPFDQLTMRARRIMNDGLRHSDAALAWAIDHLSMAREAGRGHPKEDDESRRFRRFTLRELSLGAGEVFSL